MSGDDACAVCGRTILAGERVRGYVSADGRHAVCELCGPGAERLGWRPEGEAEAEPDPVAGRRRGGLRSLLRRRPRRPQAPEPAAPRVSTHDPAAAGMRSAALPGADSSSLSSFERAAARFNASDAGRTVAGLTRTLGTPFVSVGASAGAPNEIRITVAWELTWYQWGVDLGDEMRPVFQLDKGLEISQLDAAARQWNASALEGGRIVISAPPRVPGGQPTRH